MSRLYMCCKFIYLIAQLIFTISSVETPMYRGEYPHKNRDKSFDVCELSFELIYSLCTSLINYCRPESDPQ